MSSVPLSEQLMAMAFVDRLRHEQKQVQEHLDLPRRRAEIAERIRAYYLSNNIAFDDDLIEQGVRQFFARRLMFEAPPLKRFDAWLVKNLANRTVRPDDASALHPGRWIAIVALMLGAMLLADHFDPAGVPHAPVSVLAEAAARHSEKSYDLNMTLETRRTLLATLLKSNTEAPDANVTRLLTRAQQALPVDDLDEALAIGRRITADNANEAELQLAALKEEQQAVSEALSQTSADLKSASAIIWMRQGIREVRQNPKSAAALARSSDLQQRLDLLEQQLERLENEKDYQQTFFAYSNFYRDVINTIAGVAVQKQ